MNLRLNDEEDEELRRRAEQEGGSMQEIAGTAIRVCTSGRKTRLACRGERRRNPGLPHR